MIADLSRLLDSMGFSVSPRVGVTGEYVIERAFVETYDAAPLMIGTVRASPFDADRCPRDRAGRESIRYEPTFLIARNT
jgi:hypothetical protein